MRSASAIVKAVVVLAGFSAATPAPWSVPPGMLERERKVDYKMLSKSTEHLEILALRRATPLNPDAVSDVRCWNTEE